MVGWHHKLDGHDFEQALAKSRTRLNDFTFIKGTMELNYEERLK